MRLSARLCTVLLFFSGATGLVYEFCWSKRLANWLGNTGEAHAILLATFMGGLALGAALFGRTAGRSKNPLRLYGLLELGVAACALVFPTALDLVGQVYVSVGHAGGHAARLALAVVVLLPPTLLMGGSLPAMTRVVTHALHTARTSLARLYAVNSLGAAVGSLFAGLLFVPTAGLNTSERFAALMNVTVGLVAALSKAEGTSVVATAEGDVGRVYSPLMVRVALAVTALAGFTAMLFEVTWIRLLSIIIGGTSYAFTLILAAFIGGLALGSAWLSRRRDDDDALRTLGWLQLGVAASVALSIPVYRRLPYVFFQLSTSLDPASSWNVYVFCTFLFCGALLVVPTALMGAAFPSAARVAMASVEQVGGNVGRVYGFNTVGTILGSLLGGLVLLPAIGLEGNLAVGLFVTLVAALLAFVVGVRRLRPLLALAAVALVCGGLLVSSRGWAVFVSSAGRVRDWNRRFGSYADYAAAVERDAKTTFYADDVFASVAVGEQDEGRHRFVRINGKVDGSTDATDLDTQVMLGQLGALTHAGEVKRVLVVGMGTGITVGTLLAWPVEQVDVVEISPAVLEASKQFAVENHHALDDPRCHVHLEDAKTFLSLNDTKYDLVVSEPSNPWVTGVSGLFTRDFFEVVRQHLAPGGRLVQWIHAYESNEGLVRLVVRTLRASFPHGTSWLGTTDLVLVGSNEPQVLDEARIQQRLARPQVAAELARLGITRASTVLGRQVHSDAAQARFAGEGPLNTDDHNLLEYLSPIAYFTADVATEVGDERLVPGGGGLAMSPMALDAQELAELYAVLARVHVASEPLLRSVAEAWLLRAPEEVAAHEASARAAAAQHDVSGALERMHGVVPSVSGASLLRELEKVRAHNQGSAFHTPELLRE